jgi:tetratricopeptide (TPR) repeat protein
MELVDGETLAEWLRGGPRTSAEIVAVFARAGRGLGAAHSAGLVHRDFKPNNVMIDRDGRVRVMDFGLARPTETPDAPAPPSPSRLADTLTATGVLVGTPAYMAPEQLSRQPADARTDQFSFCVALYEALCGTRPFVADDTDGLRQAIHDFALARPVRPVPGWLLRVVERGLRPEAGARWPTMDALLDALDNDPTRWRWRVVAALGTICVLAAGGLVARQAWRAQREVCAGAARKLAAVWSPPRRAAVTRAFAATGVSYAPATSTSVTARFDSYAAAWTAARTDACEATRLRGEQSEELLDRRMSCLDDRLGQLGALVELFSRADAGIVEHAVGAAAALPPVADCADGKALRARVPAPRDPAARARADALNQQLHDVFAGYQAGQYITALPTAEEVRDAAIKLDYAPLSGQARYWLGQLYDRLDRYADAARELETAALEAQRGGDDALASAAWSRLAYVVDQGQGHTDEALRYLRLARAELDRGPPNDRAEVRLLTDSTLVLSHADRFDEAIATGEKAVALARKLDVPDEGSDALHRLAQVYDAQARPADALPLDREVLARAEKQLGTEHPKTAAALLDLGSVLLNINQPKEALPLLDRAVATMTRLQPNGGMQLAATLVNRGWALNALGRYRESLADSQRAVAMFEARVGPTHLTLIGPLSCSGVDELALSEPAAALPFLRRALAIAVAHKAAPAHLAQPRFDLARALYESGQHAEARRLARQSELDLTDAAKHIGPAYSDPLGEVRAWLAQHP